MRITRADYLGNIIYKAIGQLDNVEAQFATPVAPAVLNLNQINKAVTQLQAAIRSMPEQIQPQLTEAFNQFFKTTTGIYSQYQGTLNQQRQQAGEVAQTARQQAGQVSPLQGTPEANSLATQVRQLQGK